jgi:flagellar biosynthetic protein FliR
VLAQLLPTNLFALMLVFARTGSALMLLPGFGDLYVPQRYRLLLALVFAGLLAPGLAPGLPELPSSVATLVGLVGGEVLIGLFLGSIARILLGALETAGMMISFQVGLSAAQIFNPSAAQQSAVFGAFLTVLGVLIIFLTDTHHLLLRAVVGSYGLFPAGVFPAVEDLSNTMARLVATSFQIAAELAAPFIVLGTIFYVALGLLSRLMPALQIFFVALPIQIIGGLIVFSLTLYAVMHWFLEAFTETLGAILPIS